MPVSVGRDYDAYDENDAAVFTIDGKVRFGLMFDAKHHASQALYFEGKTDDDADRQRLAPAAHRGREDLPTSGPPTPKISR